LIGRWHKVQTNLQLQNNLKSLARTGTSMKIAEDWILPQDFERNIIGIIKENSYLKFDGHD
jgi:hypothetical protein